MDRRSILEWTRTPRFRRTWLPLGILLVVLIGFAVWLLPHRTTHVVSVDEQYNWPKDTAPSQRHIVWKPPTAVDIALRPSEVKESLIQPLLVDQGQVLYFTLRNAEGEADIYRARLVDNQWQKPKPVTELNTAADEIGPAISADGRSLYFYSNRAGGEGGFDLYLSKRVSDGWSEAENLGPRINTPANEYAPAIASDGKTLYFSSNRNDRIQRRATEYTEDEPPQWTETLRAQQGLVQYDLYVARRDTAKEMWLAAEPVAALNLSNSNEGTPHITASGVFLYFTSDRPSRDGEPPNYDLYRARIRDGAIASVENLGSGVNTSANELDPALADGGFQLMFSSDRAALSDDPATGDELYALYTSSATEVFEEAAWSEGRLPLLLENWWWILLALLIAALLAALVWYVRQVSLRRAPVPGFLLIALLVHMFLASGMFFVGLGGELAEQIKIKLQEIIAMDYAGGQHQSHEQGQEAYEKVADLTSVEAVETTDVIRQDVKMPSVPVPTEELAPMLPTKVTSELPPDEYIFIPPKAPAPNTNTVKLVRRRSIDPSQLPAVDPVELEKTQPFPQPPTETMQDTDVQLEKTVASADTPASLMQKRIAPQIVQPVPDAVDSEPVERSSPASASSKSAPNLVRNRQSAISQPESSKVETEELASADTKTFPEPAASGPVVVVRSQTPQIEQEPGPTTEEPVIALDTELGAPDIPAANATGRPAHPDSRKMPIKLARIERVFDPVADPSNVPTEEASSDMDSPSRSIKTPTADVEVPQQGSQGTVPQPKLVKAAATMPADSRTLVKNEAGSRPNQIARIDVSSSRDNPFSGRTRRMLPVVASDQTDTDVAPGDLVSKEDQTMQLNPSGVPVGIDRTDAQLIRSPANPKNIIGGAYDSQRHQLVVGSLSKEQVNAPPSASPIASLLARRPARAPETLYASDSVGLQAMFSMRQGDAKDLILKAYGGNDEALESIQRGLSWLAAHQFEDGRWSLHEFDRCCKGHKKCSGHGNIHSDAAATGFALLPFLGDGHTHQAGKYQQMIQRGLDWLVAQQTESGELTTGKEGIGRMYSHAIATIALCEAFGMTKDPKLQKPTQQAVKFIIDAQHEPSGGWRYIPNERADTSVVGWQVMALKSAEMAGIDVPQGSLKLINKWLDNVEGTGKRQGQYGYQDRNPKIAMTAEALLCREYLGMGQDHPSLINGANYLLEHLPQKGKETSYYWYYGTQTMFHLQGDYWYQWNQALQDLLIETQIKESPLTGTWDAKDEWEQRGGRIYATSLRLLMLEAPYRHLPLYQIVKESP